MTTHRDNNTEFHKEEGKPMLDLLHINALIEEGRVCSYGAKKYGLRNWEEHSDKWAWGQLIASALRHIFQWMIGQDIDPETGLHHLAHARWNLGAVYELQLASKGTDDRSKMQRGTKDDFYCDRENKLLLINQGSLDAIYSSGLFEILSDGLGHVYIKSKTTECQPDIVDEYR